RLPAPHGPQHRRVAAGGGRRRPRRSLDRTPAGRARPHRRRPDRTAAAPGIPAPPLSFRMRPSGRGDPVTPTLSRTRTKCCGMTRPGDVRLAGELGVDAVGFIFAAGSPRQVTPAAARQLRLALAPMVSAVALFRDNTAEEVREVVRQIRPAVLQFHGDEDDAFCRAFRVPYMKAIPMGGDAAWDALSLQQRWPNASAF